MSKRTVGFAVGVAIAVLALTPEQHVFAQRGAGASTPATAAEPQAIAPADLTGYWVSIVSDEWEYRMLTPPRGNVDYVPLNAEGRRVAGQWDPAQDRAAGQACRAYGAGGVMRLPERLHISWRDSKTLQIEIDTGTQTRSLHLGQQEPPSEPHTWQGFSRADWVFAGGRVTPGPTPGGQLKAVTTRLLPGYLRKNGVPYGENAVLTEYFVVLEDKATKYLAITSVLEDPQYLAQPWIRTSQFKKQASGAGWNPTPCDAG